MTLLSMRVFSQSITLDEAIKTTAEELGQRMRSGRMPNVDFSNPSIEQTASEIRQQLTAQIKIAVLNFSSNWQNLSAYVIDEMNNAIVRNGLLTVVDRQQLDLVRQEQNFQMSGDVDDESAQSIGKFLGAQSVLSGSFTLIGNINRFRIRVIDVETGVLQYSSSMDIKNDTVLTALTPKAQPASRQRPQKQSPAIFNNYTFYNGLTIFGYAYSPDLLIGFTLGVFGVYTSFGFALPSWGDYKRHGVDDSHYFSPPTPNFNVPFTDRRYEIVDWVLGYNITIIPNTLYLPVGVGLETAKEWRLQDLYYSDGSHGNPEWCSIHQWENSFLFEAGLLFRVKTPINFAPYLFGAYRNSGTKKHSFSIGAGGCFDFLANKK
jgi:TolB-like protein